MLPCNYVAFVKHPRPQPENIVLSSVSGYLFLNQKKNKTKLVSRRVDYYTVLPFGRCHLLVGTGFKVFIVGSKGRLKNAADQRYGVHLPVKLFTRHKEVEVCGCADI